MTSVDYKNTVHRCFRCGFCKFTYDYSYEGFNCPMYHRFRLETYSPSGLNWLIRAALVTKKIEWSEHLSEILYSCAMCGNCTEACRFEFHEDLVNIYRTVKEDVVEGQMGIPPLVSKLFENVYLYGNEFREPRETRGDWAKGLEITQFEKGDEYLFYVGCVGSYDSCSQRAAKAFGAVLLKEGISFGILGEREECDGNEVRMLGEEGLFEHQRDKNLQMFRDLGIKKIVTLSPHSYNAFKNDYPDEFEVLHYTQLLKDLIGSGKIKPSKRFDLKVTYHDPCFLGRHNKEYDAPREVLGAIPGIELIEMDRNRNTAFCCGGGGGNFYTGISAKGMDQASNARVREAYETGANVVATSCPVCLLMLVDAAKSEQLDEDLIIKDISELVLESLASR